MTRPQTLALAALLIVGAPFGGGIVLLGSPARPVDVADFSARFSWKGIPACGSTSPSFTLSGVPRGTTALAFVMHDEQAPDFQHGGSTVPYAGTGRVPEGAITYVGPCPPPGEVHTYVWTIEARNGSGKALRRATAAGRFPP